jgi:hypothetical protein
MIIHHANSSGGNPFVDGIFLGHNLLLSQASRWESLDGWDFGYQEALSRTHSFFIMEFWLSSSLSHELFFFHDGILAIKEPFTRTFLFSRWNSGYQGAFHTNFSFFHDEILKIRVLGEDSFHIYHKEYLHRICLVKNLAS